MSKANFGLTIVSVLKPAFSKITFITRKLVSLSSISITLFVIKPFLHNKNYIIKNFSKKVKNKNQDIIGFETPIVKFCKVLSLKCYAWELKKYQG